MKVYRIQSFSGKNIYSLRPVIRMEVDIGELYDVPTKDIDGLNREILKAFPGLMRHKCSPGYEGGFVERLEGGTYLAHVTEHIILELQNELGYDVSFGRARLIEEPSLYSVIFEHKNERCGIECARAVVNIIHALIRGAHPDIGKIKRNLKQFVAQSELGPSTRAIFDEAKRRGIPVTRLGSGSLLQLGTGKYTRMIEASLTDLPSCVSVDIASDKHLTKQILANHNIPVPDGEVVYSEEGAVLLAKEIGFPVVVKPFDGNQGKGVTLSISCEEEVRRAYQETLKFSRAAIVEKFIRGKDYRILVVGGKVSAVAERTPPRVVGDGMHSVKELAELENRNPLRGEDHERPLTKIKLDQITKQLLLRRGRDEDYIPSAGETVYLRENGNLSTGGTAKDCTSSIHPYNSYIAIKAAKAVGLDIAGIDMTIVDISKPICCNNGAVIEVNAAPGLRMHLYPAEGTANNVAADIVDMLFPGGKPYSVPIVSITGTNGKTTTTRLVKHTLSLNGVKVGMTSTSGIYIGDECILKGDNTGPVSAGMVLSNREVEAAVLETARGGIVRKGLGYDLADVGVIVNIAEDHLGLDGIETLEDLAFAKSLVIEAVKPDGYAVLNADDKMTEYFLKRTVSKVILFSRSSNNPLLVKHIKDGGKAVALEDNSIYLLDGQRKNHLISLDEIPITFNGKVECNVENSLAAICALYAMNIPPLMIKKGLRTFKPDIVSNPGRFNIFDMGDFHVMLDYSHNKAGYSAVVKFAKQMDAQRLVGVIGMPGDRLDRNIREVGELCGKAFQRIYIKEDKDLRGRQAGEVAQILLEGVLKEGVKIENVSMILSEQKALESAMLDAQPGDFIILFYEDFEPAVELISKFKQELERNMVQTQAMIGETAG